MLFRKKYIYTLCLLLCFIGSSLSSCGLNTNLVPGGNSTASSGSNTTGDQSNNQLNTWYQASSGVEIRYEDWKSPGDNEDTVTIVRLDLKHVQIKVRYQPDQPLLASAWMKKEKALVVMNGGYFGDTNRAKALVIADGQASSASYVGFGGMLSVDASGNTTLRSLNQQPYDPNNEQLQQATQCSPMLIINGKRTQFDENAASSRRSVVAMDTQGRLLLIASPSLAFSLDELADLLVSSDLSIQTALNLDGGASTGLYVNAGSQQVAIDSVAQLPIMIVVQPK